MTGTGRPAAGAPDLSLVVLDDQGRPYLVLSSEPAPTNDGSPVVSSVGGRPGARPRPSERTP